MMSQERMRNPTSPVDEIREILGKNDELSEQELIEQLNLTENTITGAIETLFKKGEIEEDRRAGKNLYKLA